MRLRQPSLRQWRPLGRLLLLAAACTLATAPLACDYQADVVQFPAADGYMLDKGQVVYDVQMLSINVGFGASGVSSIDLANPTCQAGNCPVMLKGFNLDKLLPSLESTQADVLCWWGDDMPCSSVAITIRTDELACGSPTLPDDHRISPFGGCDRQTSQLTP